MKKVKLTRSKWTKQAKSTNLKLGIKQSAPLFNTNPLKKNPILRQTHIIKDIKPKKAKRIQAETGHDHMFNNFLSFICTLMIIYRSKHNNQKTNITCKESPTIAKNPSASVNKMKRITQLLLRQPTRSELL